MENTDNFDTLLLFLPCDIEDEDVGYKSLEIKKHKGLKKNRAVVEFHDSIKMTSKDSSFCEFTSSHVGSGALILKRKGQEAYIIMKTERLYNLSNNDGAWPGWQNKMVFKMVKTTLDQIVLVRMTNVRITFKTACKTTSYYDNEKLIVKLRDHW